MPDNDRRSDRNKARLGLGIIFAVALGMAIVELWHLQAMSATLGIYVFAILPFLINLGLIGAGVVIWRLDYNGREILRIAGWVILGIAIVWLLVTWTITHQTLRGRPFANAPFVTVNNLSVGALIGFFVGWYDVLRDRYRRQAETERARLEFLHSSLRHNVLNGVNIILANAEHLEGHVDNAARGQLESIRNRGEELTRFTKATKALMTNVSARTDIVTRPINLSAALTKEVNKARDQYEHADLSLSIPADVYVQGDDFVTELFANLLANAVVHNDTPEPKVSVTADRSNETVVVRVADNGPGIPDADKPRVLDWNVKGADSLGTGLGLAIANTIANRYNGDLWIEDNEPRGTIVTVELRRTNQDDPNKSLDARPPSPRPTSQNPSGDTGSRY